MAGRQLIDIILRVTKQGTGITETKRELDDLNKTGGKTESSFDKIKGTIGKLAPIVGGAAVAFATLKKAWDFGKEGAAILQTKESFDRLMGSMGVAPDILGRLRDASRGTVDDMTLMSSTMTLLAGTSGELGSAIVDAAPQLMEIAKAANKLNPTLGDTAFLYQSLATGIKRSSPLILDNLGLVVKVGDANEAMAKKLGKSVEALTAEEKTMALLNAALEAGDRMIEQVGGTTEAMGDSFAEAETRLKNAWDTIKTKLTPAVAALAEGIAMELTPGVEGLGKKLVESEWYAGGLTEEMKRARGEIDKFGTAAFRAADGAAGFAEEEKEAHFSAKGLHDELREGVKAGDVYGLVLDDIAQAAESAARAEDEFKGSMDLLDAAIRGPVSEAFDDYMGKIAELDQQLKDGDITQREYAAAVDAVSAAYQENNRQLAFNIAQKQILDALEKGLIEDTNASGTAFDEANTILWTLAETLGLTDEKTVAFMEAVQNATGAVIDGSTNADTYALRIANIAAHAETAGGDLKAMADEIRNMPEFKEIIIKYNIEYTETGAPPPVPGAEGAPGQAYQHGGQFRVRGPAGPDRVPVRFMATRGEVVTVTPVGGTPPANPAVTNNYNLNVTSNQPSAGIITDFGIMQDMVQ